MAAKELISTVTVGVGGASSIDFTSIPQTYTDLILVCSIRSDRVSVGGDFGIKLNGSTTNSYTWRILQGSGAGASSLSGSGTVINIDNVLEGNSATANTFGNVSIYIPNYAGSTNKLISFDGVSENSAATAYTSLAAAQYALTTAVTSLSITESGLNSTIMQYSTASLYGFNKGTGGASVA